MTTTLSSPTQGATVDRWRKAQPIAVALLMLCSVLVSTSGASAGSQASGVQASEFPERNEDRDIRVYDTTDILTMAQEASLEGELDRSRSLGIEALVYTRMSDDPAGESQAFADRLRIDWGVQSGPGNDDGIVYLVTVNPAAPETNSILISTGANAFPIRQLSLEAMLNILQNEMTPQVEEGKFDQALLFGVRRVLNHAEYSPPDPPGLSHLRGRFQFASNVLGAGLLQLTAIGYFLVPALRERRLSLYPSVRSLAIYSVAIGLLAVGVGIVSIVGRSTFGSLTSLAVVIWVGCIVPVTGGFLSRSRERQGPVLMVVPAAQAAPLCGEPHA